MKAHAVPKLTDDELQIPWLRALLSFWFSPADPTLLGFIRIFVGCVVVYVHLTYCIGLIGFLGQEGWVDSNAAEYLTQQYEFYSPPMTWQDPGGTLVARGFTLASVYFHITNPAWIWVVHLSILTAMFLFLIGYQTRITTVLAWLGLLCYTQRSPPTLYGMDTMANILMIYLCIGPSGAALSVDRWLEVRRLRRKGVLHIDPPAPSVLARLALRLVQIHFCIIYLVSGASKLQGSTWWDGTALWGCFANFTFAPVSRGWYKELLLFLSRHRLLWEIVMSGGAVFTIGMEGSLPFCIWSRRLRPYYIIGSIMLHTGIGLVMGLTTFSMLMFCMVICFTPPELVRPYLESFRRRWAPALPPVSVTTPSKPTRPALAGVS